MRFVARSGGIELHMILPLDLPPIHRRLDDFVEFGVVRTGEEFMT